MQTFVEENAILLWPYCANILPVIISLLEPVALAVL